jgi:hypothetical protein
VHAWGQVRTLGVRHARRGSDPERADLGAEAPGRSQALLAEADVQLGIPLAAGMDALNAAAAAAIAFDALAR